MDPRSLGRNALPQQAGAAMEPTDRAVPQGPAVRPLTLPNGETIQVVRKDVMRAALAAGKARAR